MLIRRDISETSLSEIHIFFHDQLYIFPTDVKT